MSRAFGGLLVTLLASCLATDVVPCDDGRLCPAGTECHPEGCLFPGQLLECEGADDGDACEYPGVSDGVCIDDVCRPRTCGNGFVDPGEDCDGDALGDATCAALGYDGGELACGSTCRYDLLGCDGICGDGEKDADELCDGADLGGQTCVDLGFYGGELGCLGNCQHDLIGCAGLCGDGARTAGEVCDGSDFGGEGCADHGFYTGALGCADDCGAVDTSACVGECGDDVRNGPEACDGDDLGAFACETFGYYQGEPTCTGACTVDTSACATHCGDGIVNGPELCDAAEQGGEACVDFGFDQGALGCDAFCQRGFDACYDADDWVRAPTLFGGQVRGLDDGWHVNDLGQIARWDGAAWIQQAQTAPFAVALSASGPDDVWIARQDQGVLHYDGATWTTIPSPLTGGVDVLGVHARTPTDVWVVGFAGQAARWDGAQWLTHATGAAVPLQAVWSDGVEVFAAGFGAIAHYDGAWTVQSGAPTIYAACGTAGDDVWLVGYEGAILRYDGAAWSPVPSGVTGTFLAAACPGRGELWAGGDDALVLHHRAGETWTSRVTPTGTVGALWVNDAADVWAGITALYHHAGRGWQAWDSDTTKALHDVWGTSADDVWAVGTTVVTHWDGVQWTATDTFWDLHAVWGAASDDVWAVGHDVIVHWDGLAWSEDLTDVGATLRGVWGAADDDVWAAGNNGTILRYTGAWAPVPAPDPTAIYGTVHGTAADDVWIAGTAGALLPRTLRYDGSTLAQVPADGVGAFGALEVWSAGPHHAWLGDQSTLHVDDAIRVVGAPGSVGLFGTAPDDVWSVGLGGVVRHWDGAVWTAATSATTSDLEAVWFADARDGWAVGEGGTIVRYQADPPADDAIAHYCEPPGTPAPVPGSTASAPAEVSSYPCATGLFGPERTYRLEVPISGTVTWTLTAFDAPLQVIAVQGATCTAASATVATPGVLAIDVTKGETIDLVVDSTGAVSAFSLDIDCEKQ